MTGGSAAVRRGVLDSLFAADASSGPLLHSLLHFLNQRDVAQLFGHSRTLARLRSVTARACPACYASRLLAQPCADRSVVARCGCVRVCGAAVSRALSECLRSLQPSIGVWLNLDLQERSAAQRTLQSTRQQLSASQHSHVG